VNSEKSVNILATKILNLILAEEEFVSPLVHGDIDASADALEGLLMAMTMVNSRVTTTHLVKLMGVGVPLKDVMEISDEISDVVSEIFDEYISNELIIAAKDLDAEDAEDAEDKNKPTSH